MKKVYICIALNIPLIEIPEEDELYYYVNKQFKEFGYDKSINLSLYSLALIKEAMDLHYMKKAEKCL